jgi:2'-5' RNA ligase
MTPAPVCAFAAARARFVAAGLTIANVRRDFVEWHHGRPRYLLWAVDVDRPAVQAAQAAAARHLDGLLLGGYLRQPHITLALCGFPGATAERDDDYTAQALAAQLAALDALAPSAFELDIGALASFASAPYLGVTDRDGSLGRLRRALGGPREEADYVPHVTVGLYDAAWPVAAVLPRLEGFVAARPLACRVTGIRLMSYAAADIGGPLTPVADYAFADRHLTWTHDEQPFGQTAAP